ncbi:a8eb3f70-84d6-421f-8c2a-ba3e49c6301a [Thermothielavioides terrestris]|uniref:A8eb3f70-84d6-421f-8c2a-ba3e49c6301a n=1 Tax=Thermothielavioides terrestris TaxID=2587410 RepID=A0A3S4EXA9_9PEZI|nr:a8eb3f70-84d6-421f-8c2a-ba3e49c6301a [Thermothielavioides terrestris]
MGQDSSKSAAKTDDKLKDDPAGAGAGGTPKTGEHHCRCPQNNCTCPAPRTDTATKEGGRLEKEAGREGTSDGKKPKTAEETLDFLRRFWDSS